MFFDPDYDTPQEIGEEKIDKVVIEALSAAGVDPAVVYAYYKTGLPVNEGNCLYSNLLQTPLYKFMGFVHLYGFSL